MLKNVTKCLMALWLLFACTTVVKAQVVSGEYFFDTDPGIGQGIAFDFADDDSVSISLNIPVTSLSPGFHQLFIRVRDVNELWTLFEGRTFFVIDPADVGAVQPSLARGEYFFDSDPGVGGGTSFSFSSADSLSMPISIPANLTPGFHQLFLRVQDDNGVWSLFEGRNFYVVDPSLLSSPQPALVKGEYFFDQDPGVGGGTSFSFPSADSVSMPLAIPANLTPGFHQLFLRVQDANGVWSLFEGRNFYVVDPSLLSSSQPALVKGEYFFDHDPGVGGGTSFSFPSADSVSMPLAIPTGLTSGFHQLFLRVQDANGIWSLFEGRNFYVVDPSILSASQPALVKGEYFFDHDPGVGQGTSFSFAAADSVSMPLVIPAGLTPGFHQLFLRVQDANGIWSLYEGRSFYVVDSDLVASPKPPLVEGEYFFDHDPGIGNGESFAFASANSIQTVITPDVTGLSLGLHRLFIRVKDADGTWSLFEGRQFNICGDMLDASVISGDLLYCAGETISLSGTSVTGASSYLWKGPGGFTQAGLNLTRSSATNAMSGTYSLYAIRSGGTDCDSTVSAVNVIVEPHFTVQNPAPACIPFTVDITNLNIEGDSWTGVTLSYWQDAAATVALANPSAIGTPGTYYVRAEWPIGCSYVQPVNVNIVSCGPVIVSQPDSQVGACKVGITQLAVVAYGVTNYRWQISTNGGASWSNLSNNNKYSGVNTPVLSINTPTQAFTGYQYRIRVWDDDNEELYSDPATLTVQVCPPNDHPTSGAGLLTSPNYVYPNCYIINGTTLGATVNAATGEKDVWYRFEAFSNGVSMKVSSTTMDAKVYLFDSADLSTPLKVVNQIQGGGTEILNFDGLTAGHLYRIAVTPADGIEGDFTICLQQLRMPLCDKTGTMSLCDLFKIKPTGATNINVSFTDDNENTISTTTSTFVTLSQESLGLKPEWNYSVGLIANYTALVDGLGNPEPIQVANPDACNITIAPHAPVVLRAADRCSNLANLLRNAYIYGTASNSCGVNGYKVEFVEMSACNGTVIGLPFEKTVLGSLARISLNYVFNAAEFEGLTGVGYWRVRWKPRFGNGYYGTYGDAYVIGVNATAPGAGMIFDPSEASNGLTTGENISANIYPNPNNGDMVNINVTGTSGNDVYVRILDAMGREVYTNRFEAEGSLNTIVSFSKPLASGMYMVEFRNGDSAITQRMMVSK